jgi:hypothetical protein
VPKSDKPKLDKSTLALTFKFDSDRFLRLRLATEAERDSLGVKSSTEITQREISSLTAKDVLEWVDEISFA